MAEEIKEEQLDSNIPQPGDDNRFVSLINVNKIYDKNVTRSMTLIWTLKRMSLLYSSALLDVVNPPL